MLENETSYVHKIHKVNMQNADYDGEPERNKQESDRLLTLS